MGRLMAAALAAFVVTATAATAQTLDRIRETGEIRMAFRTDAPPLSYLDAEGKPAGYSVQICAVLARAMSNILQMDMKGTFVPVTTEERFEKIAAGEAEILCGASSITLARRELVDFSIPTFVDGAAVLQRVGMSGDLKGLEGKRLGVRSATTTEEILNNSLERAGIEARVERFVDHADGFAAVFDGEIDAYFADQSLLLYQLVAAGQLGKFAVSRNTLTVEKHGFAVPRGDAEFRLAVDRVLSQLYRSGDMLKAFQSAFPGAEPGPGLQAMYLLAPEIP